MRPQLAKNMDNRPIGFLDSGVGGLTVARELMRQLPHEEIVYIGDSARAPYGQGRPSKSGPLLGN